MDLKNTIEGRRLLESLKFVLLACPKAKENEQLARVILSGNRIVAGDTKRWHLALLPVKTDLSPVCVTRESVLKLRRLLGGVVPPSNSSDEERVRVTIDGRTITIRSEEGTIERTLDSFQSGAWPKDWEPPVPDSAPLTQDLPTEYPSDYVAKASAWKDAVVQHRFDRGGPLRIDVIQGEPIALAVILPRGQTVTVAADPRQTEFFPEPTKTVEEVGATPKPPAPKREKKAPAIECATTERTVKLRKKDFDLVAEKIPLGSIDGNGVRWTVVGADIVGVASIETATKLVTLLRTQGIRRLEVHSSSGDLVTSLGPANDDATTTRKARGKKAV